MSYLLISVSDGKDKWSSDYLHDPMSDLKAFYQLSNLFPSELFCQYISHTYTNHQKEKSSPILSCCYIYLNCKNSQI